MCLRVITWPNLCVIPLIIRWYPIFWDGCRLLPDDTSEYQNGLTFIPVLLPMFSFVNNNSDLTFLLHLTNIC